MELNVGGCHISDHSSACPSLRQLCSHPLLVSNGPVWAVGVTGGGSATATALEVSMGFPFFVPDAWEAELSGEESQGETSRWEQVRKEVLELPGCCILNLF